MYFKTVSLLEAFDTALSRALNKYTEQAFNLPVSHSYKKDLLSPMTTIMHMVINPENTDTNAHQSDQISAIFP